MTKNDFIDTLNDWGAKRKPFLFIVDFEMENPQVFSLDSVNDQEILFEIDGVGNSGRADEKIQPLIVNQHPITFQDYKIKFDYVYGHLCYGDSYLTNLTTKTEIRLSHSLQQIFLASKAKYKLWYKDQFLVFSPECFIKIKKGKIYSFPMKGTIDASLPDAEQKIVADQKELAEHVTIVDLIRNDLSQVARDVSVTRFRYLEEIRTNQKNLLQVSSEITGTLPDDYHQRLGEILMKLLPAGSVTGAPKPKTVSIIQNAEKEKRGYYTGVFGYFDGSLLNSGVMIRFIEKNMNSFYYRSGGGITTQSIAAAEYLETINKVYVPVD